MHSIYRAFSHSPKKPVVSNVYCSNVLIVLDVLCILLILQLSIEHRTIEHVCTVYCVLCTVYYVLYTVYCILYNVYCVLCTVYCVQCTLYSILYTVYCILCNVYCLSVCPCVILSFKFYKIDLSVCICLYVCNISIINIDSSIIL